ncbi:MAG TPA: carboxypeptidase-like regulatory domain-containing protein [Polyangiales bacterium]
MRDETGKPLKGAVVRAQIANDTSSAHDAEGVWESTTDDAGRFSIDTTPAGFVTLDVSHELHTRTVLRQLSAPTLEPVTVILQRTAAVSGRVLDGKGQPAPNASVAIAGSGVWPPRRATTDETGRFRFDPLPEGVYELRADQETAVAEPLEGLSVDPGAEVRVELHLQPAVTLRGRVYDAETGGGVVDATVQVQEDGLSATPHAAQSNAAGSFGVSGLRPVTQRLAVRAPGYVAFDSWAKPPVQALQVALLRAGQISGHVVDEDGEPVANAVLEVRGTSVTGAPVDLSASSTWSAAAPAATATQSATAGDNLGVMRGGIPAIPLAGPAGEHALATKDGADGSFRSDAQGGFQLQGVPPGALRVSASHVGFAAGSEVPVALHSGEHPSEVVVRLSRGGSIDGRLLDPHEQPIARVRVELVSETGGGPRSVLSTRDGSFHFDAVVGSAHVTAYPYGLPPVRGQVVARAHETSTLTLVLDSDTRTLRGRVVDERGRAVESATVNVHALAARTPFALTVLSGADGGFEVTGLPEPPYGVSADQPQYAPSKPTHVSSTDQPVVIELQAGAELHGAVLDGDQNEALPRARIKLSAPWLKVPLTTRSDAEGLFEFQHVSDGNYTVDVDATGFLAQTRSVPVRTSGEGGAEHAPEAFVLVPAASASGDVVDRRGVPVWNAEVAAGEPAQWAKATRTDHQGHFVLGDLAPGNSVVRARHAQGGEAQLAAPVRVYARQETPGLVLRLPELVDGTPTPETGDAAGSDSNAQVLGLRYRNNTVVVDSVPASSAAARAGLRAGDLLLRVEGEPVRSAAQARGMLRLGGPSGQLVEVQRGPVLRRLRYVP